MPIVSEILFENTIPDMLGLLFDTYPLISVIDSALRRRHWYARQDMLQRVGPWSAYYHTVDISIVRIGLINLDILQSCAAEHHFTPIAATF